MENYRQCLAESLVMTKHYEFFKGLDADGKPIWTSDVKEIQPVFTDPNGACLGAVVYNPGIRRYILTSYHTGPGQLGIFDAPEPWGPWTTVAYHDDWGNMGTAGFGLNCDFPQKWMGTDGMTMWCVFSVYGDGAKKGINGHDKFNLVKVTLVLLSNEDYGNTTSAQTIQVPYPSSPVVGAMKLDWSAHKHFAQGSDNFQLTWADDDHLYGAWGDGGGFGGANEDGRVSLGVARVEGPWKDYRGCNVWGGKHAENPALFKGKSWGMICIKGILYMWAVPDYSKDGKISHYSEARLAKSTDHGTHWTKANWAFFESEKLIIPTICNFGKNYAGARDNYVYHYFIRPQDNLPPCDGKNVAGSLIAHKPGRIYLARVDENAIFDSCGNYQFFIGLDKNGLPRWGNISAKQPVFKDKNGTGWCVSASFHPGIGRYILCTEHTESSKGNLGVFDAPEPWGPWTTVEYIDSWGKGHVELNTFFWNFPTKWLSEDGREFTLVFTGAGRGLNNDSFNTVRGRFILKDVPGHTAVRNP